MIPSLLQIPSAVSDSKLHSVLPNNGKGDFQFERSTGATRINKDGLIEEVGYFSSELVQNGNFSELGSELTSQPVNLINDFNPNGSTTIIDADTFDSTGGTLDGIASKTGEFSLTVGKTYKIEIQGDTTSSGFTLGAGNGNGDEYGSGFGTHYFVSSHAQLWIRQRTTGVTNITSLSIKQVDPNDRWSLTTIKFTGANTFENTATNGKLHQSYTTVVGSKYKVSATINSGTWNVVASTNDNTGGQIASTGNTTTSEFFEFTATATTTFLLLYNIGASGSVASITDASVVEVQGDRPRLSYDITNGVVEDKPHLLLEPSSTNLLTFSEDFSGYLNGNIRIESNQIVSPDGVSKSSKLSKSTFFENIQSQATILNSTNYSLSVFVKKGTLNRITLRLASGSNDVRKCLDLSDLSVSDAAGNQTGFVSSKVEQLVNDWYRFTITATSNGTTQFINIYAGKGNIVESGNIYIWGAMLEQQAFSTSYIKTAGTTITRAAETCNNSKPSVNSTEGVLYAEIAALANDLTNRDIAISDGTGNNRVFIYYSTTSNQIVGRVRVSNSDVALLTYTLTDETEYAKVALKWKANDFALWVDGSERATDTSGSVFSANTLNVVAFDAGESTNDFYGKVKGLAVYNEGLTDAQLIELTS